MKKAAVAFAVGMMVTACGSTTTEMVVATSKGRVVTEAKSAAQKVYFTVTGTMSVSGCYRSGYSDVEVGAQVEVMNDQKDILGVGNLTSSTGFCQFQFSVPKIRKGHKLYGVHVGNNNRGVIWKTESEAGRGFSLTLG